MTRFLKVTLSNEANLSICILLKQFWHSGSPKVPKENYTMEFSPHPCIFNAFNRKSIKTKNTLQIQNWLKFRFIKAVDQSTVRNLKT